MAHVRRQPRRLVPAAGAAALLALLAAPLTAPAQAAPPPTAAKAVECPKAYPLSSVTTGLKGQGQTVVTGTTPQPFDVEVLGVLADGLGAGRDMIIIKVTDVVGGHVIDQGSGIWAGMSGSPVYVDGKLLGAVSYGFTNAPSPIGGLTPAAEMLDLLTLEGAKAEKAEKAGKAPAKRVALSASAKAKLAAAAGVAAPRGTLQQLVTPLAVSGVGTARLAKLQTATDAAGWSVKAYAAGRRNAPTAASPTARPQAGGNFAATLSYGDLTAAAIGTTTYVCGDQAIAFGHRFNLSGPASYGANDASSVAIVTDNTSGSFKMANLGASFGTVDQDRTAGLRADLSAVPTGSVVSTTVENLDTGKVRDGSTTVVDRQSLPGLLADVVFSSQDAVFDEWGDGVATSKWTISGTRAGGKAFAVTRANRWASRGDVTVEPAFDVAAAADALLNNDFEDVRIDKVAFSHELSTKFEQLHITRMRVAVNGGRYVKGDVVKAKVGDKLTVRVDMSPFRSRKSSFVKLRMVVPKSAKGLSGEVSAAGGVDLAQGGGDEASLECLLVGEGCTTETEESLDSVISGLKKAPHNDAVTAQLALEPDDEGSGDEKADDDEPAGPVVSATKLQKLTVTGRRSIEIAVR